MKISPTQHLNFPKHLFGSIAKHSFWSLHIAMRMDLAPELWLQRPLAPELLECAAADLAGLLPLAQRLEADLLVRLTALL